MGRKKNKKKYQEKVHFSEKKVKSDKGTDLSTVKEPKTQKNLTYYIDRFFKEPVSDLKEKNQNWTTSIFRLLFASLSIFMLASMILMGINSGINEDDSYQNDYSEKLIQFYTTFGENKSALDVPKGRMHFYGGFFDVTTGMVNKILGNDPYDAGYHHIRHIFNAFLGFMIIFFMGLFLKELVGWKGAVLGMLFLFLSPRFLGHSLMNPKDIPFAAGYIMSIYFMLKLLHEMPKPKWSLVIGLGLSMGLALGTRAGAMLIWAYFGLFALMHLISKQGIKNIFKDTKLLLDYIKYCGAAALLGFIIGILFWPYALVNPIEHISKALTEFSQLTIGVSLLFEGANIKSNDIPWYYPFAWIWRTIPLFVLLIYPISFLFIPTWLKKFKDKWLYIFALYFATIFPLAYITYQGSSMYDGWRHLIFIYPTMGGIAALCWLHISNMLKEAKILLIGCFALLGIMMMESGSFIIRNISYPYVYFNTLSGGVSAALGNYELDYWGLSIKPALLWLEKEGHISPDMDKTVTIRTTYHYHGNTFAKRRYNDKVKITYARFRERYNQPWDFGIFPSRYIKGPHLRNGTWPNSRSIHEITANGTPIASIETGKNPNIFEAERLVSKRDFNTAISYYQQEIATYPDNEVASKRIAWTYLAVNDNQAGINYANKTLEIAPDDPDAILYRGIGKMNLGRNQEATEDFNQVIEISNMYAAAHYYQALLLKRAGDNMGAFEQLKIALKKDPKLKLAYKLLVELYEESGDRANAQKFRDILNRL